MNAAASPKAAVVVLDTNVVLDLFLFDDPAVRALKSGLESGAVQWLATAAMRAELARVLDYPNLAGWIEKRGREPRRVAAEVLAHHDRSARTVAPAAAAPMSCSDPDDQMFIDLAFAYGAGLFSKDRAVLDVWRRLGVPDREGAVRRVTVRNRSRQGMS